MDGEEIFMTILMVVVCVVFVMFINSCKNDVVVSCSTNYISPEILVRSTSTTFAILGDNCYSDKTIPIYNAATNNVFIVETVEMQKDGDKEYSYKLQVGKPTLEKEY